MSRLVRLALILAPRISTAFTVRHTRTNLTWAEICNLEHSRAVHGRVVAASAPRGACEPPAPPAPPDTKPLAQLLAAATPAAAQAVVAAAARRFEATLRARGVVCGPPEPGARHHRSHGCVAKPVPCRACAGEPADTGPCAYAHFADDTSRKAAARLAGARLCVRVCVDPQVLARAAAADKKKDQEVETSRCTTFHLLPLAALQASKADIKRVFRSRAEVAALLNGTQADGFPDDASLPVSLDLHAPLRRRPVVPPRSLPKPRAHERCAVVGSGHHLRCAGWGAVIDSYDAVFRTNAAQGSEDVRRLNKCGMGARTDYHVHPDLGKVKKEAREAARRATPNARLVAKHLQEWREITRRGLPAHLATDAALRHEGHGGSGMGSGSTTLALAAALCESVDAYGFGAYRGRGGAFAYIHFYDEEPWLGDAKGGELVFAAELRNALFDALGVFRWVWW